MMPKSATVAPAAVRITHNDASVHAPPGVWESARADRRCHASVSAFVKPSARDRGWISHQPPADTLNPAARHSAPAPSSTVPPAGPLDHQPPGRRRPLLLAAHRMIAGMKGVRLRERTRSMPELSDTHVLILAADD